MFLEKPGSTVRHHFTPIRMVIIQKMDMEKLEPSGSAEYKIAQPLWESLAAPHKVKRGVTL